MFFALQIKKYAFFNCPDFGELTSYIQKQLHLFLLINIFTSLFLYVPQKKIVFLK